MDSSKQTEPRTERSTLADDTYWDELEEYIRDGAEEGVESILEENAAFITLDNINRVLHMAVAANRENIMTLAIYKGADINSVNENGDSPLHIAVRKMYCAGLVQRLISLNANQNIRNRKNQTPLDNLNEKLLSESRIRKKAILHSVKALLIEEAIQPNEIQKYSNSKPTESSNGDLKFECSKGLKVNLTGAMFQTKLLMLFAKRAMDRGREFRLATEIESAGKFDDVVLRYEDNGRIVHRFVQAKHRDNPIINSIREFDLFGSDKKGDFNIVKYFISFNKISNSNIYHGSVLKDFIICTNTDLEAKSKEFFTCKDLLGDEILYINTCAGKKYQLKNENDQIARYLTAQMKMIALNSINTKAIECMKEKNINEFAIQLQLVEKIKNEQLHNYNTTTSTCDKMWTFENIKNEGSKAFDNYLSLLSTYKKKVKNSVDEKDKTAIEKIYEIFPIDGESPSYTNDLKELKAKACSIIHEHKQKVTNQKALLIDCCVGEIKMFDVINEFLNKFFIVTNYAGINELNNLISHELGSEFQLLDASLFNDSYEKDMLNWVRSYEQNKSRYFLGKDSKEIFNMLTRRLNTLIVSGVSKSYVDQICKYNIFFEQDQVNVKNFILSDNNILHVTTKQTRLSALKIIHTLERINKCKKLDSVIFASVQIFQLTEMYKRMLNAFSSDFSHNILVIECDNESHFDFDPLSSALNTVLNNNPSKKLILIARSEHFVFKQFTLTNSSQVFERIMFKELEEESRKTIFGKYVFFQENRGLPENKIQLKDLMDENSANDIIDEEILWWLIKTNDISVGGGKAFNSIGYNEEYYIKRTVQRQIVDRNILSCSSLTSLVFITGPTVILHNLQYAIRFHGNIHWWDEVMAAPTMFDFKRSKTISLKARLVKVILSKNEDKNLNQREKFELICEKYSNVLWLEYPETGILLWRDFKCWTKCISECDNSETDDMKLLTNYIRKVSLYSSSRHRSNEFDPKTLEEKVIIVANDPGEGKSTMLTGLSYELKTLYPHSWIVRINLTDLAVEDSEKSTALNNIEIEDGDMEKGIDILANIIIRGDPNDVQVKFQRETIKAALTGRAKIKLIIMVDGFDEISPNYKQKTSILLRVIKNSNVSQLWVTTRVHLKMFLENALQTPAYTMIALTREEQVSYLNRYWKWNLKFYKDPCNETTSAGMLDLLKNCHKSISQCMNEGDVNSFSPRKEIIQDFLIKINLIINDSDAKLSIMQKNVYDLNFSAYAGLCLDNYQSFQQLRSKTMGSFTAVPQNLSMIAENMLKRKLQVPKSSGMYDLYRQFVLDKFEVYQRKNASSNDSSIIVQEQCKRDVMTLQRAHRELAFKLIFPDFYKNNNLSEMNEFAQTNGTELTNDELSRIGLVRYELSLDFVHRTYAEYFLSEHLFYNLKNDNVQKVLCDICVENDYRVVRLFLNSILLSDDNLNTIKNMRKWKVQSNFRYSFANPLFIAVEERILGFMKLVLNIFEVDHLILFKNDLSILSNIYDAETMNILLDSIENDTELFDRLLFWENSSALSVTRTKEVAQVLLERVKKNPNLFRKVVLSVDNEGSSVLHLQNNELTIKTILEMVQQDTDLLENLMNLRDEDENTALHVAIKKKNAKVAQALLEGIETHDEFFKQYLLSVNEIGKSALHYVNTEEIVKTILKLAQYKEELLENVLLLKDNLQRTVLHTAVLEKNTEVVHELLKCIKNPDFLKTIILNVDAAEKSALCYAMNGKMLKTILEIVKPDEKLFKDLLLIKDIEKRTILHTAVINNNNEVVHELMKCIKNLDLLQTIIMSVDAHGKSALCYAMHEKIVKTIVEMLQPDEKLFKDLLLIRDNAKRTTLHTAVTNKNAEVVHELLQCIKNPDLFKQIILSVDVKGKSALHYATKAKVLKTILEFVRPHKELFKDLLLLKDKERRTVLHVSMGKKQKYVEKYFFECITENKELLVQIVQIVDVTGKSILHHITNAKIIETIVKLVHSEGNLLKNLLLLRDHKGRTALHIVRDVHVARALLKCRDNDLLKDMVLSVDELGKSVLHYLTNAEIIKAILEIVNSVEHLLENLLFLSDKNGQIVLYKVIRYNKVAEALLELTKTNLHLFKKIIHSLDKNGRSVLHYARKEEILKITLEIMNIEDDLCKDLLYFRYNEGSTALHVAVRYDNEIAVQNILKYIRKDSNSFKAYLLSVDAHGKSVLHYVPNGEILKIILECAESHENMSENLLLLKDYKGETVLHVAMRKKNKKVTHQLLEYLTRNVHLFKNIVLSVDKQGNSALRCVTSHVILKNMLEIMQSHEGLFEHLMLLKNNEGKTILHSAMCNIKIAKVLMEQIRNKPDLFKNLIQIIDKYGKSALHYVIDEKIMKTILEIVQTDEGLFERLLLLKDNEGKTALHTALDNKAIANIFLETTKHNLNLFKKLILSADVQGQHILHNSMNMEILRTIIEVVSQSDKEWLDNLLLLRDKKGRSALHTSLHPHELLKITKGNNYLFKKIILMVDTQGRSVLHSTNWKNLTTIFNMIQCDQLLEDLLLLRDINGKAGVHVAMSYRPVQEALFQRARNNPVLLKTILLSADEHGRFCAIHYVTCSSIIKTVLDMVKCYDGLLEQVLLRKDNKGRTALHEAMFRCEAAEELLKCIKDNNYLFKKVILSVDVGGKSPLHHLKSRKIMKTTLDMVKCDRGLLEDVLLLKDHEGTTVLHAAMNMSDVAEELLKSIDNNHDLFKKVILSVDINGKSPLHCAESGNMIKIALMKCDGVLLEDLLLLKDNEGRTVLHEAMYIDGGAEELLKCIENNHDLFKKVILSVDINGKSPLHCAESGNMIKIALMKCDGVLLEDVLLLKDNEGRTILHEAMCINEGAEELLKCIKDNHDLFKIVILSVDINGKSPLHCAESRKLIKTTLDMVKHDGVLLEDVLLLKDNEGRTTLHVAMNSEVAEELLKCIQGNHDLFGKVILNVDKHGRSPLHYAVDEEDIKTALDMAKHDEDLLEDLLLLKDNEGKTVLHAAMDMYEVAEELLKCIKDNHDLFKKIILTVDIDGMSPLHYAESRNIVKTTLDMVKRDAVLLDEVLLLKDNEGRTALHVAMSRCEVAKELLKYIKDNHDLLKKVILSVDINGKSPLHCAKSRNIIKTALVKCDGVLLEDVLVLKDNEGRTLLHEAMSINEGADELLKCIKDNHDLFKKVMLSVDINGKSPLHWAQNGRIIRTTLDMLNHDVVLLEDVLLLKDNEEKTVLHVTMNSEVVEELLKCIKDNHYLFKKVILSVDMHGKSPLHYIVDEADIKTALDMAKHVEDLLDDVLLLKDNEGRTVLHAVINIYEVAEALLKCINDKQDLFEKVILSVDIDGKSPLHFAESRKIIKTTLDMIKRDGVLLEDVLCLKDNEGRTALHVAMNRGEVAEELLKCIKDNHDLFKKVILSVDMHGKSPLHYAVEEDDIKTALDMAKQDEYLFENVLLLKDNEGRTSLHAFMDIHEVAEELLKCIKDDHDLFKKVILSVDVDGKSPLHYAESKNIIKTTLDMVKRDGSLLEDMLLLKDNEGRTALHAAMNKCEVAEECLKFIKDNHDLFKKVILSVDIDGKTPLHYAKSRNIIKTTLSMVERDAVLLEDVLLLKDNEGRTALHVAMHTCEVAEELLKCIQENDDLFEKVILDVDMHGKSPLHYAIHKENIKTALEFAIHYDDDLIENVLFLKDNEGKTLMQLVVMHKLGKYVMKLVKNNSNPILLRRLMYENMW